MELDVTGLSIDGVLQKSINIIETSISLIDYEYKNHQENCFIHGFLQTL
jgi:hypothetical protein